MVTSLKIALVEDNDDLRGLLARDISRAGYIVQTADCADSLDELSVQTSFDLLVLDLNLPGENGLSVAQRYKRANQSLHIIMLTARTRPEDRVTGYESGADVYLTKPISSAELIAAIGSVARRLALQNTAQELQLDVRAMTLSGRYTVELNRHEVIILKALSESPNGSLPYFRLLELCGEVVIDENAKGTLEVRVVRLRKKLADAGIEGKTIRAIRGEGYQLLTPIKVQKF